MLFHKIKVFILLATFLFMNVMITLSWVKNYTTILIVEEINEKTSGEEEGGIYTPSFDIYCTYTVQDVIMDFTFQNSALVAEISLVQQSLYTPAHFCPPELV